MLPATEYQKSEDLNRKSGSGSIKAIDGQSVHQICSGQVILNLSTAVKELVENSIDAGASIIDIKLKNYGIENIDVQDNGSGIEEKDYESVCLKHCTSKLRDFSDLSAVDTFGFRGEALSSLCALSKVSITTRHETKEIGYKLEFDNDGRLISKIPCAREKGTTVSISQLFYVLPVRHKEFKHHIKREFSKLCTTLQAYGIINSSVRFCCINYTEKNKRTTVVSTPGSPNILDNMSSMFGPKQTQSLLAFTKTSPRQEVLEHFNITKNESLAHDDLFSIQGYISRIDHGCGRSAPDRQFYYVNKRPCDLPKISRLTNEVYHMFNRNQYPLVVLDVSLQSDHIDVNVTPDKRQIFIQQENLLLAILKSSLLDMFTDTAGQYERCNTTNDHYFTDANSSVSGIGKQYDKSHCKTGLLTDENFQETKKISSSSPSHKNSLIAAALSNFRSKFARTNTEQNGTLDRKVQTDMKRFTVKVPKEFGQTDLGSDVAQQPSSKLEKFEQHLKDHSLAIKPTQIEEADKRMSIVDLHENTITECELSKEQRFDYLDPYPDDTVVHTEPNHVFNPNETTSDRTRPVCQKRFMRDDGNVSGCITETSSSATTVTEEMEPTDGNSSEFSATASDEGNRKTVSIKNDSTVNPGISSTEHNEGLKIELSEQNSRTKKQRLELNNDFSSNSTVSLSFDICNLRNKVKPVDMKKKEEFVEKGVDDLFHSFHAKIIPNQNRDAEDELRKNITKEMFKKMEIIGQFNLGFIIAKLDMDLFIIDQHATDEKYNFEMLQKEHCLKGQKLISPRSLELNAVNQNILIDNIEIFNKNGFDFQIDESKPINERVKLVSLPTSKNWTFDVQDIEELIFMLSDNPGVLCRPSRVRNMFASRACRMSTMVGSPLKISQMKKLVSHMAEIEHPWNCPHGRPTMRHLVNLHRIKLSQD